MASEEVRVEKVPWILVIVLSAFLVAFGITWVYFLPAGITTYYSFSEVVCASGLTAGPFIILMFTALFSKIFNRKISVATLTYLYVLAMTTSWLVSSAQPYDWNMIVASRHMNEEFSAQYIPWFMAPPAAITSQLINGHVPVPWPAWIPNIMYYWVRWVLLSFFMVAIATIFRRQWIDVEKLPFPHTMIAYELIRKFPEEKRSIMEKLGRPFLLGVILGLVFQIPVFMTITFPWFPDIYSWKTLCGPGFWYVQGGTDLARIAGLTTVNEHPIIAAVGYILPLSITFNVWFWYIIWLVLMQASYAMGFYTGIENSGGCGRTGWCSPSGMLDPPLRMQAVTYSGGLTAITVAWLVLNRKYVIDTFKMGFQTSPNKLDIEKNEGLSYRNTYLLLGGSAILSIILFLTIGMSITSALVMLLTYFIIIIAQARIYGMTGLGASGASHGGTFFRLVYPTAPDPLTTDYVMSAFYSLQGVGDAYWPQVVSTYTAFASYKMANFTGVSNRNVLKIMLTAMVIAPLVLIPMVISLLYAYGASTLPGVIGSGVGIQNTQFWSSVNPASWISKPARDPWTPYMVAGFLVVLVLEYLHTRFVQFPLSGVGFVIGMSRLSVKWGFWGPFLVAWVLKSITLRIGGSKLYERLGVPIVVGFVVGYMIAIIFGGTMGVLRFFVPY